MLRTIYEQAMRLLNIRVLILCVTISHPIKATWIDIFERHIQKLVIKFTKPDPEVLKLVWSRQWGGSRNWKIPPPMSDLQSLLKQEMTGQSTNLTCRSIRIGSYKTLAKEKVYFTQKAIYIRVPYLTDSKRMITLVIPATGKIIRRKNICLPFWMLILVISRTFLHDCLIKMIQITIHISQKSLICSLDTTNSKSELSLLSSKMKPEWKLA